MFQWSKNNRACTTTWTTLIILDQTSENFMNSGSLKIHDFTFWNAAASSDILKLMAKALAIQMDNIFNLVRGAKYENGISKENAISDIVNILVNSDKTIADLAEINDRNYSFWPEVEFNG